MEGSLGSAVREGQALSESPPKGPNSQTPQRRSIGRRVPGAGRGWELMFKGDKFSFAV